MIDWITADLPYHWEIPISGGQIIHVHADGEVDYTVSKRTVIEGSWQSHITLRTVEMGRVQLSGNPSKFLQGHNLFGSDDLPMLVTAVMDRALAALGRPIPLHDRAAWVVGDFQISRVDVTYMYALDTRADVRSWLRAASEGVNVKWRGRGAFDNGTLTFGAVAKGKRASTWQMVLYCKGDEMAVKGRGLPDGIPSADLLSAWVDDKLRIELRLRTGELKRAGLRHGIKWGETTPAEIFGQYFGKLELSEDMTVPVELEEQLSPALRMAYNSWKTGQDMRAILPRRTFFHYRKKLLVALGVDISVPQPKSNVVPLRRVLELRPAQTPSWAFEHGLIYGSDRRRA